MAPEKNFKLQYEHITYHFEAHDLEIQLIFKFRRNIKHTGSFCGTLTGADNRMVIYAN